MTVFHIVTQQEFDDIVAGRAPQPKMFNPFVVSVGQKADFMRQAQQEKEHRSLKAQPSQDDTQ